MYKEYLIVAMNQDHSDTKVYWDSTPGEVQIDIALLRNSGFEDIEAYRIKIAEKYDFDSSIFEVV